MPEASVVQAAFEDALSAIDVLRRGLRAGAAPVAEVYVEGARGALHHAREAELRAREASGLQGFLSVGKVNVPVNLTSPLCAAVLPAGWRDEVGPARPDLGADLIESHALRGMSRGDYLGAMLASALAHHAWLHEASGEVWSTDRSGAAALVGALSGGRAGPAFGYEETLGTVEVRIVHALAGIGWRRFRSPRYEGPVAG
jgi:hypothetical protein